MQLVNDLQGHCCCCPLIGLYYFLLVLHCKCMPVLHCFRDINTYLPKIKTLRDLNHAHLGTVCHHHKTNTSRVNLRTKFDDSIYSRSGQI